MDTAPLSHSKWLMPQGNMGAAGIYKCEYQRQANCIDFLLDYIHLDLRQYLVTYQSTVAVFQKSIQMLCFFYRTTEHERRVSCNREAYLPLHSLLALFLRLLILQSSISSLIKAIDTARSSYLCWVWCKQEILTIMVKHIWNYRTMELLMTAFRFILFAGRSLLQ